MLKHLTSHMHGRILIVLGQKGFILYSEIQLKGGLPKRGGGGVHWVTEGGFLVPKTAGGESFKEILGQQKCQGWKLPSHKMEMSACCQFEHL